MAKLVFTHAYDISKLLTFSDWTGATVSATSSLVTLTLGTNTFRLSGAFTVSGGQPTGGTISSVAYLTETSPGVFQTEFTASSLSLSYASFNAAIADDDFGVVAGSGNDQIVGSSAADRLGGGAGNDVISAAAGNDTLLGSYGNDTLDGGTGGDSMVGGSGNDLYLVDSASDQVVEAAGGGIDTVITGLASYVMASNVENLVYTSVGASSLTGNVGANTIAGNLANDTISGGDGNDTLRGGNGNDTLNGGNNDDLLIGDAGGSTVTTSATGQAPSNPSLPLTLTMSMPEIVPSVLTGTPSATVTGYINNASTGSAKFNLAFVLDVSGSMGDGFSASNVGDVNHDGQTNEKVDAAIASFQALVSSIKSAGLQDMVRIGLVSFSDTGKLESVGTAVSDADANGVADVVDAALRLNDTGGTNYAQGLNQAIDFFSTSPKAENFVFFISDGQPSDTYNQQLATLRDPAGINASIRSIGIEAGGTSYYDVLDLLDDGLKNKSALDVKSPSSLTAGLLSSNVNTADVKQLEIYKNGVLVQTLTPSQLIDTPFGLRYSSTITDISTTSSDTIETRLLLNDAAGTVLSTRQQVGVGTLASNDSLVGGAGNDTLDGGAGTDTLVGGTGDDTYHLEQNGTKTLVELAGAGIDTVEATFTTTLNLGSRANIENLVLLGSLNINATGNAAANRIEGNIGNNVLEGLGGNDTLVGAYGNDTASYHSLTSGVSVNLANGTATSTGKIDQLSGIEAVWGSGFNDSLAGDAGDNTFRGYAGTDTITGGGGLDTIDYSAATAAVSVVLTPTYLGGSYGTASGSSEGTDYINYYDVEGIRGSAFADTITDAYAYGINNRFDGGAGNDSLSGGSGNDTLIGGAGNDTLDGGIGVDVADYSAAAGAVSGSLVGTIVVGADSDSLTGVESFIGSRYNDSVTGSGAAESFQGGKGNDTLTGGDGNDTIDGGAGADRMVGGLGDDTFYIDSVSDVLVEASAGGTDKVFIDVSAGGGTVSLGGVEVAVLLGSSGLNIIGGSVANDITGGNGNDTITGGTTAEADTLSGGAGIDTLSYAGYGAAVVGTLNDTYSTPIAGDITSNFENVLGSSFGDTITGDYYNNLIDGGAGDDSLNGGSGNDTLVGGLGLDTLNGGSYGLDTVSYSTSASAVNVDLSTGTAINDAGNDLLVDIERVVGTASNDVIGWQNTGTYLYTDFILEGGAGNDSLTGSSGNDTLSGGAGDDTLNGGTSGTDWADYSTATAAVTVALGTSGSASGGAGVDVLQSVEAVIGSKYADSLTGLASQSNIFVGGAGADTLDGGATLGVDYTSDTFKYTSITDSRGSAFDTIKNFTSTGTYDQIDLSAIDANTTDGYDSSSFNFVGTAAFSGTAGELRYAKTATDTMVYADVNGDKVADMTIKLLGLHDLTSYEFYL